MGRKPRANATPNQPPAIDLDDPLGMLGEDRPAPAPPVDLDDPLADAEELPPEAGDVDPEMDELIQEALKGAGPEEPRLFTADAEELPPEAGDVDPEMDELIQEALDAAGPEEPKLFVAAPAPERFIFTDEHVELRGALELHFVKGAAKHTLEVKATLRLRLQAPDQAAYLERTGAVPGARNVYESGQPTEDHDPASGVHTARNRWGSVLAWTFRPMGDVGPLPLELTADAAIRVADVSANNGAVTLSIGLKPFVVGIDHARLVWDLDGCDVVMTGRAAQGKLL